MPWYPNPSGGAPIQAPTNPNPGGGSLGYYSDPSYNGPPPGGGGGGGGGQQPAAPFNNPYNSDLSGLATFAGQTSGTTQAQLAQQKAEFDAQLQFAQQQMQQLGIPQLQINQFLAQMQQRQFQAQLVLAQQAQQYSQAATTAGLTGWYTPPQGVPDISQYLQGGSPVGNQAGGQGGGQGAAGQGGMSWNQLAQQIQAAAGSSYNDAAAKALFQQLSGQTGDNFNGGAAVNLTPAQIAQIMTAGGAPAPAPGAAGGGPVQTLAGQLQQAQLTGQYQGAPTEAAREFNQQLGLQQGQLGQQYLSTASQLQGPQNTFQLSNYLRGAQGNQAVPAYLQALANNIGMPAFQGTGSTAPTPQSAAGLMSQMGYGQAASGQGQAATSATPGWDYNQTLGSIRNIMGQGGQSLGPGALERLSPDELQAFGSGLGAVGGSLPAFLQQYQQSRIGQQAPVAQTSLA
jgi:hypothetical protein